MCLNPVGTELYDAVFADQARTLGQLGTEVHSSGVPETDGRFIRIE